MSINDSIDRTSVTHITFSTHGGAGKVAQRLVHLQSSFGIKSTLITATNGQLPSLVRTDPNLVARGLLDFYVVRKTQESHLFSLFRNLDKNNDFPFDNSQSQVVHLHWTPGIIGFKEIQKLVKDGKKVVWTTHDMWPMTGGCHHALGCEKYQSTCAQCPQVRKPFQSKVSESFAERRKILDCGRGINLIAPSEWMGNQLKTSSVFTNAIVNVIPNYLDTDLFSPRNRAASRQKFGISEDAFVIGCAAADLSDPMKGISDVMEVARKLLASCPEKDIRLLMVGDGNRIKADHHFIKSGLLDDDKIVDAYNSMDVFVSASLAESFSYTLAEAAAVGIPRVCLNVSSMPELIETGVTGLIANSLNEMVQALISLVRNADLVSLMGSNSRDMALLKFSAAAVHEAHLAVYRNYPRDIQ